MQDRSGLYGVICAVCLACAVAITLYSYFNASIVADPWPLVIGFVLFATLAEFLAVDLSGIFPTLVTPTSMVYWVTTCVLGPFASIIVCATAALLSHVSSCASFHILNFIKDRESISSRQFGGQSGWGVSFRKTFMGILTRLGENWYPAGFRTVFEVIALHAGTLVISAGLSGLAYHSFGGRFLIDAGHDIDLLRAFVLPFFCLVVVSIAVEYGEFVFVMALCDPVRGATGLYRYVLRAKLALIEVVLPLWRGELFLVIVALLLSYLYAHIKMWSFILAIMPVLALRDFFNQWISTKTAYLDTITTLATYMQHYHPYTRGHLKRVADMSERLARELRLPAESIRHINTAGFLHDIGKVGVSEDILDKTDKLTDDEWAQIKEHPVKGAEIIAHLEFLEGIVDWIRYHHKWYNGSGYPANGAAPGDIPIEAAIIATADAFDAMTDDRELALDWKCDSCGYKPEDQDEKPVRCPECGAEKRRTYRVPKTLDQAIDELRRGAGSQFHPKVVKAFLTMVERDGVHLNVQ